MKWGAVTIRDAVELKKEKEKGKCKNSAKPEIPKVSLKSENLRTVVPALWKVACAMSRTERESQSLLCRTSTWNGFQMKGVSPFDALWAISKCSLPFFNFCQCWLTFKSFSVLSCESIPLTLSSPIQCVHNCNSDKSHFIQMQQLSFCSSFLSQNFILFYFLNTVYRFVFFFALFVFVFNTVPKYESTWIDCWDFSLDTKTNVFPELTSLSYEVSHIPLDSSDNSHTCTLRG